MYLWNLVTADLELKNLFLNRTYSDLWILEFPYCSFSFLHVALQDVIIL